PRRPSGRHEPDEARAIHTRAGDPRVEVLDVPAARADVLAAPVAACRIPRREDRRGLAAEGLDVCVIRDLEHRAHLLPLHRPLMPRRKAIATGVLDTVVTPAADVFTRLGESGALCVAN